MNIYKTQEQPSKNELLQTVVSKKEGIEYIDQYVINYLTAIYGEVYAKYVIKNRQNYVMSLDDWHVKKDTLPKGHYFIEKDELVGYTIYVICETVEEQEGYMWNSNVLITNIIKVSSIFGVMKNMTIIDQSIIGVRAINVKESSWQWDDESYDEISNSSTDEWGWDVPTKNIKKLTDTVNAEYTPITAELYEQIGHQINMVIKEMNKN